MSHTLRHHYIDRSRRETSKTVTIPKVNLYNRPDLQNYQQQIDNAIGNLQPAINHSGIPNNVRNIIQIGHSINQLYILISRTTIKIGIIHNGEFITFIDDAVMPQFRNMSMDATSDHGIFAIRVLLLDGYEVEQNAIRKFETEFGTAQKRTIEYFQYKFAHGNFAFIPLLIKQLIQLGFDGTFFNTKIGSDNENLIGAQAAHQTVHHGKSKCYFPPGLRLNQLKMMSDAVYMAYFNGDRSARAQLVLSPHQVYSMADDWNKDVIRGGGLTAAFPTMIAKFLESTREGIGQDLTNATGYPFAEKFIRDDVVVGGGVIGGGAGGGGGGGGGFGGFPRPR